MRYFNIYNRHLEQSLETTKETPTVALNILVFAIFGKFLYRKFLRTEKKLFSIL